MEQDMFKIINFLILCLALSAGVLFAQGAGELRGAHSEAGLACVDCHGTDTPDKKAPASACMTCHADHKGEVREYTNNGIKVKVNPHASHQGDLRCTLCHKIHSPSKLYCNQEGCHAFDNDMNVK